MDTNKVIKKFNCHIKKQFGGKYKWTSLTHNGVLFHPEYKPHGIPLKYKTDDNKIIEIKLDPVIEEILMLYVKYIDTEYIKNKTFNKNFWHDFMKINGKKNEIKHLENCDFTDFINEYKRIKENNKAEKNNNNSDGNSNSNSNSEEIYKIAYVDGKLQTISNYRIEPPGIYIGRGNDNPNLGKIKKRINPENVTLNIGKDEKIPKTLDGHKWKKIIHDRTSEWIASWKDNVTGKIKYVRLDHTSDFKKNSDQNKFDLALKLKKKIKKIIKINTENLNSSDLKLKQIATSVYFIDKMALRVGNEKSNDETDTVGVTSLRLEHIVLKDNLNITLDFLGKDSIRYYNTIKIDSIVYNNLETFMKNKNSEDQLFDLINSNDINKYLQTFMKKLTAKVFRTYNASHLFQIEINKINKKYEGTDISKINKITLKNEYNEANAKVAKLCNHQKNVSKTYKKQIDTINENIKELKKLLRTIPKENTKKIKKIKDNIKKNKLKKKNKNNLKNISLNTSKINYIDPRITYAFIKKYNIPIDTIYTKVIQKKFKWAENFDDFKFQ
jgi:DNA topoisomerase-1